MNGFKKILVLSFAIATIGFASSVYAEDFRPPFPSGGQFNDMRRTPCPPRFEPQKFNIFKEIGVSESQQKKIDEINASAKSQIEPLIKSVFEKEMALREYIYSPKSTKEDAWVKENEISQIKDKINVVKLEKEFAIKNILSEKQQKLLLDKIQERKTNFPKPPEESSIKKDSK